MSNQFVPHESDLKVPSKSHSNRKTVFWWIFSIVGVGILSLLGIFLFAFVILPKVVSRKAIQDALETSLANSLTPSTGPKDSLLGAPASVINPYFGDLQNRDLAYRWNPGESFAYDFSFTIDEKSPKAFRVNGDCKYTVGPETMISANLSGSGTAFAIGSNFLATSAHIVKYANRIDVTVGGKRYAAKIVDIDSINDLAILAIDGQLEALPIGSAKSLEQSDTVIVVGYPKGEKKESAIKVSAGIVTHVDEMNRSRAITIDGSIDPGNRGGPVLNQKGQLVGIASATVPGDRGETVGFACLADRLRDLMTKNSITAIPSPSDSLLESKEIAKRVSPSLGFVDVSGWADQQCNEITYLAKYSGSMVSPSMTINGVTVEGTNGKLTVSRLGEIKSAVNAQQLPFLFQSIPELIFQRFDLVSKEEWSLHQIYELNVQQPRSGIGRIFNPLSQTQVTGRPSEPGIPAEMETRMERMDMEPSVARFKKIRKFRTLNDKNGPALEVNGEGIWEFDTKIGLPIHLEENLVVVSNNNGKRNETPIVLKISKVDVKTVQERQRIAKESADKQKADQTAEETQPNPELIDTLIADLQSEKPAVSRPALTRLSKIAIVESKRETVLSAARKIISSKERFPKNSAWVIYSHWSTVNCVPEIRRIIEKSAEHRKPALDVLIRFKLVEDAPLFIKHFGELSHEAQKALVGLGPEVETLILEQIPFTKDAFARYSLITVLEEIGTEISVKRLKELKTGAEMGTQIRMDFTIKSIEQRLK